MKIPKNKIALLVSILAVSALAVFCGILVMTSDSFTPNTKYSFTVLLLAIEAAVIVVLFTMQEQLIQRKDNAAARKEIADQEKAVAEKGFLGVFTGGFTASAAGICAAVFFGFIVAVIFKSRDKSK